MTDEQIINLAASKGFAISAFHGTSEGKLMPISDRQTLIDFVREVIRLTKS